MTTLPQTAAFTTADGYSISYRHWQPGNQIKAIVVIVHGFNAHSGYYQWPAEQLIANGFEVFAIDLRGRGNSDGERFYINDYHELISDIDQLVGIALSASPGLKVFLLGHSAGGVLSAIYTLPPSEKLSGFICESFAFRFPAPDFAIAALKGLSHLAPHAHVVKLKNEDFTRDPAAVEVMNNDPLIAHEVQSTKTIQQLALADEELKSRFNTIQLPLLILHGTADKATKPSGSEYFYEHAGSPDKTLKLYEGYYHDLLNDTGKEIVMKEIIEWLKQRI
ncbi:alpha/beta hydrolase [Pinibacter soli]|uniref:Lysophospholipase n=1 Tax=Pinibacter soli TaxID=3044211 RepID=A0ABT6REA3_9BACT|nr:alpha/beta hydrolase [Pinibacter soli]MDI3320877.1 lysophospholipase [Pinibacter soli]